MIETAGDLWDRTQWRGDEWRRICKKREARQSAERKTLTLRHTCEDEEEWAAFRRDCE